MKKLLNILFFNLLFNFSLFAILIIGIQNSRYKSNVRLLNKTTINLPISFIVGSSFILGSITGSLSPLFVNKNNIKKL